MTDTPTSNRNDLIIAAVAQLLRDTDPKPFTPSAVDRVHDYVAAFINDLVLESIAVMRRHEDKVIVPSYVEIASKNLRSRRRQLQMVALKIFVAGVLGACLAREIRALFEHVALSSTEHIVLTIVIGFSCSVLMWLEYR